MRRKHYKWLVFFGGLLIYVVLNQGNYEALDPSILNPQDLMDWVKNNLEEFEETYEARRKQVKDLCSYHKISDNTHSSHLRKDIWLELKKANWDNIFYVPQHNFIWCKVPKAGSSTWVYNLLKLTNISKDKLDLEGTGIHGLLRLYYPKMEADQLQNLMKTALTFIVVRHPFERILSAYRDKLENYERDLKFRNGYYYENYGKNIVANFRNFSDKSLLGRREPTFNEFVTYLLKTPFKFYDEHWMPMWYLCSPCLIKYQVISKMETFSQDTAYLLQKLGLGDILKVEWVHKTSDTKSSELAHSYFSKLTQSEVWALYLKYKLDFEIYHFDQENYLDWAIDDL